VLPEIGGSPPDRCDGAVFYDASIMGRLLEAVASDESRPIIAAAVNAIPAPHDRMRRIASAIADAARNTAPIVAYQSPLGPLDAEFVNIAPSQCAAADGRRQRHERDQTPAALSHDGGAAARRSGAAKAVLLGSSFMDLHRALRDSGVCC